MPTETLSPSPAVIEPKQLARLVAGMRAREGALEMSAQAQAGPSMMTQDTYRTLWGIGSAGTPALQPVFKRCRQLYATNDLTGWYVDTMVAACNDGCAVACEKPDGTEDEAMKAWLDGQGFDFTAVARDVLTEFILCSNAVLFWRSPDPAVLPEITVLDCECCEWLNAFGANLLKVNMEARTLSAEEKEALGQRYADAFAGRQLTVKNGEHDEYFRVLTGQKNGAGLRLARLYQIFQDLSLRDLLRLGDWNAAWLIKNIIRLVRRGHDIKTGPLAGQDIHFLKTKEAKKIRAGLATNTGTFDMVTNFDVNVVYSHLDPKYLETAKYKGVTERLHQWLGPLGRMLAAGAPDPDTMKAWEVQCLAVRGVVGKLLEALFNHADFLGQVGKPPQKIKVTWSANTFTNLKYIMERVRLAQAAGISSTQTAREDLGYHHERESARLRKEQKDPAAVTPAFEQKQGMVAGKGGRPANNDLPPAKP